jgi:SAM-dependent methyltransferase
VSAHVVNLPEVTKGSPDRFGYSWDRYADVLPEHEEQFLRWTTLDRSFWQGVRFLDGGCGIGRNAYWPMTYGARGGVAVDVDDRTLGRARHNLAPFPNLAVRKQSIYEITEEDTFDIAFSIGVVHHLSDPDAAVARLTRAVKSGGLVLLWLYGRENNGWIVHLFNPLRRALFSRLPLPIAPRACAVLAADRAVVVRLAPGSPARRLLPPDQAILLRSPTRHRVRPHDPAHRALLYARGGRGIAGTSRPDRYSHHLGQRELLVGDRSQADWLKRLGQPILPRQRR